MNTFALRAKTLLTALPTYLVIAVAIITIVAEEVSTQLGDGGARYVTRYAAIVLGVLGAAISIVRRVTPVIVSERGLLPVIDPTPVDKDED